MVLTGFATFRGGWGFGSAFIFPFPFPLVVVFPFITTSSERVAGAFPLVFFGSSVWTTSSSCSDETSTKLGLRISSISEDSGDVFAALDLPLALDGPATTLFFRDPFLIGTKGVVGAKEPVQPHNCRFNGTQMFKGRNKTNQIRCRSRT